MTTINILTESNFNDLEVITEAATETSEKSWYIKGPFLQADVVNKNRRIYPLPIMEAEINSYINEYVSKHRSIGELNHPDTPIPNPERASHLVEEIVKEGKNFVGKAKILNTTCGNIVRGLLEGGVQLGVSSRATGSVKSNRDGINEVQSDFRLGAIDVVFQPSAPAAFVEGLMENADFVWNTIDEDVEFMEHLREDFRKVKKSDLSEAKIDALQKWLARVTLTTTKRT